MTRTWMLTLSIEVSEDVRVSRVGTDSVLGEERWPGQYIDVTRMRRQDEQVNWPRPA